MTIYMIRHGETEWNARHVLQGTADIPLNHTGRKQAQALAREIQTQNLHFDRIYVSPLGRARETAHIATGEPEENMIIEPRLIEIEFGPLEESPYELRDPEAAANLPENLFNFGFYPELYVPPEGAESFQDVIRRTGEFLDELLPTIRPQEKVLLVSHGCALHGVLYNLDAKTDLKTFWKPLFGNCKLMEWKDGNLSST